MTKTKASTDILDKKFVCASVVIGIMYTIVVLVVSFAFGRDAAGVSGAALSVLALGIFKQFESLRFRQLGETEGITVVLERPFVLLTCAFSITGGLTIAYGLAISAVLLLVEPVNIFGYVIGNQYAGIVINVASVLITTLTFIVSTYVTVRSLKIIKYSTVALSVLIVATGQLLVPSVYLYYFMPKVMKVFSFLAPQSEISIGPSFMHFVYYASPWLIYLFAALFGARLARPQMLQVESESDLKMKHLELELT